MYAALDDFYIENSMMASEPDSYVDCSCGKCIDFERTFETECRDCRDVTCEECLEWYDGQCRHCYEKSPVAV